MSHAENHADLQIVGMRCASCSSRLEKALNQLPDVSAVVNLATEKASVTFDPALINVDELIKAVRDTGFDAHVTRDFAAEKADRLKAYQHEKLRFYISLALIAPMVLEMLLMLFEVHLMIPTWVQWALATPVQFWIGARFYRGAWASLKHGSGNMDLLVALGTSAAYFLSVVIVLFDIHQPVYFESSAVLITLVLMGKLLEMGAKAKASSAIEKLIQLQPKIAHVERDGQILDVSAGQLRPDDIFIVRPGENVPVDGVVLEGMSTLDESMLTGESMPQSKQANDKIYTATLNHQGMIKCRATAVGSHTRAGCGGAPGGTGARFQSADPTHGRQNLRHFRAHRVAARHYHALRLVQNRRQFFLCGHQRGLGTGHCLSVRAGFGDPSHHRRCQRLGGARRDIDKGCGCIGACT